MRFSAIFGGASTTDFAHFLRRSKRLSVTASQGGYIVLMTNAPRSRSKVIRHLDQIGVTPDLYHDVVTSGDAARRALSLGEFGQSVHHIGPAREETFFLPENDDGLEGLAGITLTALEAADGLVCTGLVDDTTETPHDYIDVLRSARDRNLKMLCANPDLVVDRGVDRVYCAGALAELYASFGGEVLYFGKPHKPIYTTARLRMNAALDRTVEDDRILCIGDGLHTDMEGAVSREPVRAVHHRWLVPGRDGHDPQPRPQSPRGISLRTGDQFHARDGDWTSEVDRS